MSDSAISLSVAFVSCNPECVSTNSSQRQYGFSDSSTHCRPPVLSSLARLPSIIGSRLLKWPLEQLQAHGMCRLVSWESQWEAFASMFLPAFEVKLVTSEVQASTRS